MEHGAWGRGSCFAVQGAGSLGQGEEQGAGGGSAAEKKERIKDKGEGIS